ncbi:yippee zinc-binding/DNA-binding /Mis18, centromere assembly-domain-containing protein [Filobasidium floriforme]|uniref:yippee zinc-binding/DNA-binding /Mis18, centromere assembly-domain-containing protein n=1 Tax=Filobasidium floriforme TaxID=5210 RepID=UPI001E8D20B7|nr:yippee zinc-binding/DNA-binding /Mis18, centromere assembly-domain-containing protein [Filobasidium floriforme]KAH8080233.1 yippee zinc-binding/DNA-binding /Mis18, centromere assembly-domain-containing protein [Filobasidium floriforme]
MRPPGFLSIALRRASNASQSSVEDDSQPTTPGPATASRSPGFDHQGEVDTGQISLNVASSTTAVVVSSTNQSVPPNQFVLKERPDLDLESKLKAVDRKAKESVKVHYFPKDKPVYSCRKCLVPIALQDELVSKAFSGRDGRAYLMHSTVNTKLGKVEERRLLTGLHTVADLFCTSCDASLGWTYLKAQDRDQVYKEGKYILEASKTVKENNWELGT